MLIFVNEPHYKIITAVEGGRDDITDEDAEAGIKGHWTSKVYERDGDKLKLVDAGQVKTSNLIRNMDRYEIATTIMEYWEMHDAPYSILEE